jgi:hypothetical protein
MIEIDLSADLRPMLNRLQNVQRQLPFVIASSLTRLRSTGLLESLKTDMHTFWRAK